MLCMQFATLALAGTALAASGCGGSAKPSSQTTSATNVASSSQTTAAATTTQSQPSSPTPPLTTVQLIAKADPICARVNAERVSNIIRSKQDYIRVSSEVSSYQQRAIAELVRLIPPASLASTWNTILDGYRTFASDMATISHDVATNQTSTANDVLAASGKIQRQTAAVARRAGFKDCGNVV
jgi:hypothetical protein